MTALVALFGRSKTVSRENACGVSGASRKRNRHNEDAMKRASKRRKIVQRAVTFHLEKARLRILRKENAFIPILQDAVKKNKNKQLSVTSISRESV